ncbi:tandem-95 repeat protein [Vibrio sp. 10N]|uniref:tandem-95 repeat protein n=1 Tax=Vibrio sp. 10N TaxID=3058938 RepID=UPI002812B8AF|nr:hypothetical protein VB10N_45850 [Vibrio sp. 10N]
MARLQTALILAFMLVMQVAWSAPADIDFTDQGDIGRLPAFSFNAGGVDYTIDYGWASEGMPYAGADVYVDSDGLAPIDPNTTGLGNWGWVKTQGFKVSGSTFFQLDELVLSRVMRDEEGVTPDNSFIVTGYENGVATALTNLSFSISEDYSSQNESFSINVNDLGDSSAWSSIDSFIVSWNVESDGEGGVFSQAQYRAAIIERLVTSPAAVELDQTPPVFQNSSPTLNTVTTTGATLSVSLDEKGTAYFVVVANSSSAPSAGQVKTGKDASGADAIASGSFAIGDSLSNSSVISVLSDGTDYDVYVVAEDDESTPNVQVSASKLDLTTTDSSPNVSEITVSGSPAANATSIDYLVTFGDEVSNIATTDFTAKLDGAANAGVSVASVSASSGTSVTVTVSVSGVSGAVRLDLDADNTIVDESNTNPAAFTSGATHTTDTIVPTVTSIVRKSPIAEYTNSDSLVWTVTFSESLSSIDGSDFAVTGATGVTISPSASSGSSVDVTVSGGGLASANSVVSLAISSSNNNLTDAGGNGLSSVTPTGSVETYTVDNTAPTFSSVDDNSGDNSYKAGETITITAGLGESGLTVNANISVLDSDFGSSVAMSNIGSNTYSVTTSALDLNGNMLEGTSIAVTITATDAAGNQATDSSLTLLLDKTAPTFSGSSSAPADNSAGVTASDDFVLEFSEAVRLKDGGTLSLMDVTNSATYETYSEDNATSGSGNLGGELTLSSAQATLNPASSLLAGTQYAIQIGSSTLEDLAGNSFAGISDNTTYNFTTRPELTLTVGESSVKENGGQVTFTLSLVDGKGNPFVATEAITVALGKAGTGIETDDYLLNGLSGSNLTIGGGASSASFTLTAQPDAIDDNNESVELTISSVSSGSAVIGSSKTASVVISQNSPAVVNGLDSSPVFSEGGSAVVIDSNVTVSDVELDALNSGQGNYSGASLTISRSGGADNNDVFGNSGLLSNLIESGDLTYNNVVVGTVTTNSAGTLTLTFNSNATTAVVNSVLQAITYQNSSDDPSGSVELSFVFNDGVENSSSIQVTASITGVNDIPTLAATGSSPTFVEGSSAVTLFSSAAVSTVEASQTLAGLVITVTNVADAANETLNIDGSSIILTTGQSGSTSSFNYSVSVASTTATITLTGGTLTETQMQSVIDAISYSNGSDDPTTASNRVVTITSISETGSVNTVANTTISSTISVTGVDDEPIVSANGLSPTYTEGAATSYVYSSASVNTVESSQTITGATFTISGVQDGSEEALVVDATEITLVQGTSGTTPTNLIDYSVSVSGNVATVVLSNVTGTAQLAQQLLNYIGYIHKGQDPTEGNRVVTLTEVTDSGSNSGDNDNLNDTLAIASTVSVSAVDDAPTLSASALNQTFTENGSAVSVFSSAAIDTVEASQLIESITWQVTGVANSGSEYLVIDGSEVSLADRVSGTTSTNSFVYQVSLVSSGVFAVSVSKQDTTSNYQTLIDGITYRNTAENIVTGTRTISITELVDSGGSDGDNLNSNSSLSLTSTLPIVGVNDDPSITIGNQLSTDEDNNQTLSFNFSDVDGDTVTATEKAAPSHGEIAISGTDIVYTPTANYNGSDSFTITLTDGNGYTVDKTINVTVSSVNDDPSITIASTLTTDEDNNQTLSFNFSDVDGDTVTATEKSAPSHGEIAISGTDIVYTPTANYNGSDSFTITLTDGNGYTVDKTINVTVSSVNDEPSITIASTLTTDEDNNQTLSFNFSDVDGDTVTATEKSAPSHGEIAINGTDIVYTPTANYNGSDSFTITLTDGNGYTVDKTINVTVSSVNDEPSITIASTLTTDEDNNQTLSFNFSDVDGDTVTATEKSAPSHGEIAISGTDIVYTPTANYNGSDSFTITLTDGNGYTVDKTINVTVSSVNDEPSITIASTLTTDEDNNQTLSFNFSDVDGDTVTATEKSAPSHGEIAINGTDIVYTPTANYNGSDSFTITLTDGNGYTVDKTINVTVSSVNDEPSITIASTLTTDEDNNQTLSFNFSDVDGDTVTATEKSAPSHGEIAISGTDIVYTPTANYNGSDSFTITLTDGNGYTVDKTINVTVSSVNDEPSITIASTLTTDEDNNQTLSFNFSDVDGDTVTATEKSAPSHGEIAISGTDIVYTPTANYNGSDSFTITLTDGNGYTVDKTINVTVSSVNDEPSITIASTLTTDEDNNQTLSFNFSDVDGDTVTATEKSAPSHGEIAINGTDIVYTPTANYNGSDSFTITLTDGSGYTVDKTINVTVSSVNDEPSITIASTLTTDEDNNQTLSFNFSDVDGDTVTATEKSAPSHGEIAISGTDIVYTPTANYNGSDSFTITLTDGNGYSVDKTINVTVSSVNDEPSITIASTLNTDEDNNQTLSFNFSDVDGDTVTATEKSAPSHGEIAISGTDIVYTPTANYNGSDSFTITLTDGSGYTVDKTINVTVSSVNDEPSITIASTLTTDEDNNQTLSFNFSDVDGDTVTATEKSAPSHGEIAVSGTDIVYTPTANYNGSDSFTITLTDGSGYTVDKTINVTVSSVNDEPSITIASTLTTDEDNNQTLSFNFSDVDGDTVTATEKSAPSHGEIAISGTDIVYTPTANYNGSDSFTITLTDGSGYTVDKTINVTVSSVNDEPSITIASTLTTDEDNNQTLSFNFSDVDGDTVTATEKSAPSHGEIAVSGTDIVYTPTANYNGSDSFTITLTDGSGYTVDKTINVTVSSVNDEPSITIASTLTTDEDNNQTLSFNFSDVDGDTVTATEKSAPSHGEIAISGTDIVYTPTANYNGSDSFTITLTDGSGYTVDKTINVTVSSVNDEPSITIASTLTTDEDNNQTLSFNFSDVDGDTVTATEKSAPSHGEIAISGTDIVYTPTANYNGSDSFTITLTDGNGYTVDKTINVTVSSVNDEPSITIASTLTTDEDNNQTLSFNFSDVDGDTVTATEKSAPSHGEIAINGTDIVYTPTANYNGSDSFTITLTDGNGYTVDKTINVTVSSVNDEPSITIASTLTTDEDNNQTLSFNFSDVDGDTVTATEKSAPSHGEIAISGTDIVYTPTANYNGSDSFTITLTDGNGYTVDKTINVTVSSVNDEPSITIASTLTTDEDNNQTLSFNFSDVDGDTVTATEKSAPSHGQIVINGTDIVYTPTGNYNGSDSFTITLTDDSGYTVDRTINVQVISVNDAPVVAGETLTFSATPEGIYNFAPLANDVDPDDDTLTLAWANADTGTLTVNGDNIELQTTDVGVVTIKYGVIDGNGAEVIGEAVLEIVANEGPTVTPPDDVEINATALFTKVDLGVATALDSSGLPLPVVIENSDGFFTPGVHKVSWAATDQSGNTGKSLQTITVNPLISIEKNGKTVEGTEHQVAVYLNGEPSGYPVVIPYTVGGTMDTQDHDLVSGEVVITSGLEGVIDFEIFNDDVADSEETLLITLADSVNLGSKYQYILTVYEVNVAPDVTLQVIQNNEPRTVISPQQGTVTITAVVDDVNPGDSHQYRWINDNSALANISQAESVFEFDPSALVDGVYELAIEVTDSGNETVNTSVFLEVVAELATLGEEDTDGDLIPDNQEGYSDSDGDGIPDFQDAITECNVIQSYASESSSYLVEGEPGVCLRKGVTVANAMTGGALLLEQELPLDDDATNVGGLFDYVAIGLPIPGQSYSLVLPQSRPIPRNAVYRKYSETSGWITLTNDGTDPDNYVSSAPGFEGYCPPPGDASWQQGQLIEGHWCVQLTIKDGGVYDDDGEANGRIVDPGGVATTSSNTLPQAESDEVNVVKGGTVTINVLANDSDGDGDALQVTSASSQLGTVSIENNQLVYQAPTDFFGVDTLSYGISDGNGGTAFSNVSVNVNLASNDVVRNSSSGGSLGGWLVMILAVFGTIRAGQVRASTALLALLTAFNVNADWFLKADIGQARADDRNYDNNAQVLSVEDRDTAWLLGVGYRYNQDWAVSVNYINLGKGSAELAADVGQSPEDYHRTVAKVTPALGHGIGLDVDYTLWENDKVSLNGIAGALAWRTEFESLYQGQKIESTEDGVDPYLAFAFKGKLSPSVMLGAKISRYFIRLNDVMTYSATLEYHFGDN